MTLLSPILTLDRTMTLAINNCHSPLFDQFFYLFSRTAVWSPFFILLIFLLWRSYGWRNALSILLAVALAILVSDQFCNIFKYTVCRLRPTHEPSLQGLIHTVNGYLGGDYGFCSSHAANTVSLAIITALLVRRWYYTLTIFTWTIFNCWSRIYLGVHYLGDILCGLMVGSAVSFIIYLVWQRTRWKMPTERLSVNHTIVLIASYFITVLALLILPNFTR